jgi:hypothetical protein
MISVLIACILAFFSAFSRHRDLALENLALRQQPATFKRRHPRPRLRSADRLFWVWLSKIWAGWREALIIVKPETVIAWHRQAFRFYWIWLSRRKSIGRPRGSAEVRTLIKQMAQANPLWGAPRIHGELQNLGLEVSERTVSRLMPRRREAPSQRWRTFLNNHLGAIIAIDFFTVPSASYCVLFVTVVPAHHRRRIVHFNVTANPTAVSRSPTGG